MDSAARAAEQRRNDVWAAEIRRSIADATRALDGEQETDLSGSLPDRVAAVRAAAKVAAKIPDDVIAALKSTTARAEVAQQNYRRASDNAEIATRRADDAKSEVVRAIVERDSLVDAAAGDGRDVTAEVERRTQAITEMRAAYDKLVAIAEAAARSVTNRAGEAEKAEADRVHAVKRHSLAALRAARAAGDLAACEAALRYRATMAPAVAEFSEALYAAREAGELVDYNDFRLAAAGSPATMFAKLIAGVL